MKYGVTMMRLKFGMVMEAGKDEGLIPAGFGALDLLRIEAGLII